MPVSHARTAAAPDPDPNNEEEDGDDGKYAELKLIELREMSHTEVPQSGGIRGWYGDLVHVAHNMLLIAFLL